MTRPRRSRLDDPTAEYAADAIPERNRARDEDLVRRTGEEPDHTPRRYEQSSDDDPVMPSDESGVNTKIRRPTGQKR